jgi:hypothetical protein
LENSCELTRFIHTNKVLQFKAQSRQVQRIVKKGGLCALGSRFERRRRSEYNTTLPRPTSLFFLFFYYEAVPGTRSLMLRPRFRTRQHNGKRFFALESVDAFPPCVCSALANFLLLLVLTEPYTIANNGAIISAHSDAQLGRDSQINGSVLAI